MSKHVKRYFLDWLENKTDIEDEIEYHLKECDGCRLYYERMTELLNPEYFQIMPRLVPDPYLPARIVSLLEEAEKKESIKIFTRVRLSLEGVALILAVFFGIVLGKTVSQHTAQYNAEDIISIYRNAISPEDFTTQFESIFDRQKGGQQ